MAVKQIHELDNLTTLNYEKTKLVVDDNQTGSWKTQSVMLSTILSEIYSSIYPIGSIYITTGSKPPYGTWELIANGCCLWGVAESSTCGQELASGLPNLPTIATTLSCSTSTVEISGETDCAGAHTHDFKFQKESGDSGTASKGCIDLAGDAYGVFKKSKDTYQKESVEHKHSISCTVTLTPSVTASTTVGDSTIYGKSTIVQPPAYTVHMYKRIS